MRRQVAENLQAFWPGMESLLGKTCTSARLLNAMHSISSAIGFMPEEFDYVKWQLPDDSSSKKAAASKSSYLLRPELIESTYMQYRSTGDRSWLIPARAFLDAMEKYTVTDCGFAIIGNMHSMELSDSMPSYFLAETCKYLYLLFDEKNFVNVRPYVFSTEAHPFDPLQLHVVNSALSINKRVDDSRSRSSPEVRTTGDRMPGQELSLIDELHYSLSKCPAKSWWSKTNRYDSDFTDIVGVPSGLLPETFDAGTMPQYLLDNPYEDFFCYYDVAVNSVSSSASRTAPKCSLSEEASYTSTSQKSTTGDSDSGKGTEQSQNSHRPLTAADKTYEELRGEAGEGVVLNSVVYTGSEGKFIADVYASGFSVASEKYGNLLHIFGVGNQAVFATERPLNSSPVSGEKTAVMGTTNGYSVRCYVRLFTAEPLTGTTFDSMDEDEMIEVDFFDTMHAVKDPSIEDLSPAASIARGQR